MEYIVQHVDQVFFFLKKLNSNNTRDLQVIHTILTLSLPIFARTEFFEKNHENQYLRLASDFAKFNMHETLTRQYILSSR